MDRLARSKQFLAESKRYLAGRVSTSVRRPSRPVLLFFEKGEGAYLALRFARAFTGRPLVVKFEGHYHGWSDGVYVSYVPPQDEAGPAERPNPVPGTRGQSVGAMRDVASTEHSEADIDTTLAVAERCLLEVAGSPER